MLVNLSLKMLVAEGGFEAKLAFINPFSIDLIYLKNQIYGTNVH